MIFKEFVPYNRLAGRGRDFLESIGLLWFYNYKLRIMKIAVNTMRERLFRLWSQVPESPLADTVFSGSLMGGSF